MNQSQANGAGVDAVTGEADMLILVDAADREVGHLSKEDCHRGRGVLHRAFSLLVFNPGGQLLLQQRAAGKRLWPHYWSNSCCSHPRRGETMEAAIHRRLDEELGLRCPLQFLFKFQYQAQFDAQGGENELCSVFIGRCTDTVVRRNDAEVQALRWIDPPLLQRELQNGRADAYTPWFVLEWARIWGDHREALPAPL